MNPYSLTPGSTYIIQPLYPKLRNVFFIDDMPATFIRRTGNAIQFRLRTGRTETFTLDQNGKLLFSRSDPESEVKLISSSYNSPYVDNPQTDRLEEVRKAMMSSGFGEEAVKVSSASNDLLAFDRYKDKAFVQNDLQNQQKLRLRRYYNFNIIYRDPHRNIYEVKFSRLQEPRYSGYSTRAFFILPTGREITLYLKDGKFSDEFKYKVEVIGNLTFEEYEMQQMQLREQDEMKNEDVRIPSGGKSLRKRKCRKPKSKRRKLKGR